MGQRTKLWRGLVARVVDPSQITRPFVAARRLQRRKSSRAPTPPLPPFNLSPTNRLPIRREEQPRSCVRQLSPVAGRGATAPPAYPPRWGKDVRLRLRQ